MLRHGHGNGNYLSQALLPSQTFSSSKSQTFQTSRSTTDPSILSERTKTSGPTQKEPALITSKWSFGWQVPTLILACYAAAIAIALTHLILFKFIDGKPADGPKRVAPQSYVTIASNIMANAFGFSLRAGLSVSFAQYLWHLFRVQTMKVSTIELLFAIRSNPFQIFRISTLSASPTLCLLAAFIWALQVVISFPPGSISVITIQHASFEIPTVPTLNASFRGNGSGAEANANSLITLTPDPENGPPHDGFSTGLFDGDKSTNLINRLARQVLITGESFPMQSPCGGNCSYRLQFEGPYTACSTNTSSATYTNLTDTWTIYSGQWISPPAANLVHSLFNGTYTLAHLNATTLTPLSITTNDTTGLLTSVTLQADNTICTPGRANYSVHNTWVNNVYSRQVTRAPVDKLTNLAILTHSGIVVVPGFTQNGTHNYGTASANWTSATLAYYRDNNYMAMFDAMMSWLSGEFHTTVANTKIQSNPPTITYEAAWDEQMTTSANGVITSSGKDNHTLIDNTRFNSVFNTYNSSSHPQFQISEDVFNDYLLKMTMSTMQAYGRWNTSVNATRGTAVNVYSFSAPLNLLLPYCVTLVLAVPFILLGGLALNWNGVSAMDGGFIQIITTSTGSAILDRAAAGGCLGGNESVPQELNDLEIRFGEFIGRGDAPVKRAGFGVESEITTLKRGANYGIARWI